MIVTSFSHKSWNLTCHKMQQLNVRVQVMCRREKCHSTKFIFAHGRCLKISSTDVASWKNIMISRMLLGRASLWMNPLTGNWLEASSRRDPKCLSKAWSSLKASRMGNPLSIEAERGRTPQRQPPVTRDELLDVLEVIRGLDDLRHLRERGF